MEHSAADLKLLCKMPQPHHDLLLPASRADTAEDVATRIQRIAGLSTADIVLRHNSVELSLVLSLDQQSVKEGDVLAVYVRSSDAAYLGPDGETLAAEDQRTSASAAAAASQRRRSARNSKDEAESTDGQEDEDALPSYGALMSSVTRARQEGFMKTLSPLNACWLGLLILLYLYGFLGFLVIMPIVTLATGVQGKCDGDPHILTWLEVYGSLGLVLATFSHCAAAEAHRTGIAGALPTFQTSGPWGRITLVIRWTFFAWVFVGANWVFTCDEACQAACASNVYNVAFGLIVALLIYMAIVGALWLHFYRVFRVQRGGGRPPPRQEGLMTRDEINAAVADAERREEAAAAATDEEDSSSQSSGSGDALNLGSDAAAAGGGAAEAGQVAVNVGPDASSEA